VGIVESNKDEPVQCLRPRAIITATNLTLSLRKISPFEVEYTRSSTQKCQKARRTTGSRRRFLAPDVLGSTACLTVHILDPEDYYKTCAK
jgi:hypothetical protein